MADDVSVLLARTIKSRDKTVSPRWPSLGRLPCEGLTGANTQHSADNTVLMQYHDPNAVVTLGTFVYDRAKGRVSTKRPGTAQGGLVKRGSAV